MASCKNRTKPRAGLMGCVGFNFNPTLVTPIGATVTGNAGVTLRGSKSPGVTIAPINASGKLVAANYDDLVSTLIGRAIPIQNIKNQSETAWFLDNLGSGTECCDTGTSSEEYTTTLLGLNFEIPRSVHGIAGFPDVVVLDPTGAKVSVVVEYVGNSIFLCSNIPLDNHTAILR